MPPIDAATRHGTLADVSPNQPKTPQRTFRVPTERYEDAKREAEARGESLSDAVNRFLDDYGARERARRLARTGRGES